MLLVVEIGLKAKQVLKKKYLAQLKCLILRQKSGLPVQTYLNLWPLPQR